MHRKEISKIYPTFVYLEAEYFFAGFPANVLISIFDNYQDILNKMNQDILNRMTGDDINSSNARWVMPMMAEELERKNHTLDETRRVNSQVENLISRIHLQQLNVVKTVWIGREIDKITSMVYFVIVVAIFIGAVFLSENFINHFLSVFQGNEQLRLLILVSSLVAIIILLIMIAVHLKGLLSKALITYLYLTELDAIKFENEHFNPSLKDIEQYLSNGDWTMAEYWVEGVMREYDELIESKVRQGGKNGG